MDGQSLQEERYRPADFNQDHARDGEATRHGIGLGFAQMKELTVSIVPITSGAILLEF